MDILAGMLFLGNINIEMKQDDKGDYPEVTKDTYHFLEQAAKYFCLSIEVLEKVITKKVTKYPG